MLKKGVLVLLCIISAVLADGVQRITAQRGRYQLNFDVTYRMGVSRDIQTMIQLPGGYSFVGTVIGAGYYVSVSELQNVMYLTKLGEDNFETNVIFHILTPEGFDKKLIFTVHGVPKAQAVYAIQFDSPNFSEINDIVRAIKAQFDDDVAVLLSEQEISVRRAVNSQTLSSIRTMEIRTRKRGSKTFSNKGVEGFIDGIYNSEGVSYIRVITNVPHDNCQKVRLIRISRRKGGNGRESFLFDAFEDERGRTVLIFETAELVPVMHRRCSRRNFNHYRNVRYRFHFKIWDEDITRKLRVS